tara:strand:- start:1632 stop:3407 length:1776 start_codon:yes stop_codon:yes gene_type:complete
MATENIIAELEQKDGPVGLLAIAEHCNPDSFNNPNGRLKYLVMTQQKGRVLIVDCEKHSAELGNVLTAIWRRKIVGHGLVRSLIALEGYGWMPEDRFCTETASHLIHNGRGYSYELKSCVLRELKVKEERLGEKVEWSGPLNGALKNALGLRVNHMLELAGALAEKIEQEELSKAWGVEMELIPALCDLHCSGILVDRKKLESFKGRVETEVMMLRNDLKVRYGIKNPNSARDIHSAFLRAGLEKASTRKVDLQEVDHPLADSLVEFKEQYSTGRSCKQLLDSVEEDGRAYSDYDPLKETGRVYTKSPNIQGLKKDQDLMACLCAEDGKVWVRADYKQQEVRVLAAIAGDERLIKVIRRGEDPLVEIAAAILGKQTKEIADTEREMGKQIFYANIYGCGLNRIVDIIRTRTGKDLGKGVVEQLLLRFEKEFEGVAAYVSGCWTALSTHRAIKVRGGGRRLLEIPAEPLGLEEEYLDLLLTQGGRNEEYDEISSARTKRLGQLLNTPIQAGAAAGIKIAMSRIRSRLPDHARLGLYLHDELGVECLTEDADKVGKVLAEEMIRAMVELFPEVKFDVDVCKGQNWAEMKELKV